MATKYQMKKLENSNIRTCEVRLSFPELFTPKQGTDDDGNPSGKPKYSSAILFPAGADLSVLEKEIDAVIKAEFPGKTRKSLRVGLRDQGEKDYEGYEDGAFFLNCSSLKRPPVVDRENQPVTEEDEAFPGVRAIVTIRVYAFKPKKGDKFAPGIGFGLQAALLLGGGERMGGAPANPNEEFEGLDLSSEESADSIFGDEE
ncbi:DUF2815 family protein [Mesorhizobium sp. PAMC28654]|uniref:ssDNA-binding protein n=1 Tax=Mesorhizobium sp. PAMC28654 TaxID=2880934 RepID=UPI001D09E961|nr:ssDNA-binding protein [Mesorhizobium sp. PAMC28654]UDL89821.1 DUF2815 family protein [Mesorhizobium sp. PAMC28654]